MRPLEQHPLDLPHVRLRQPPVVVAERAQVDDRIPLDASGEVDVRIEVAERERARRREHRLASVQARIARPRDRSPAARPAIDEDDVIEQVDRLEAEDERRVAVLLEDHRRRQRRLEAVRGASLHHAAKAAERFAPFSLLCGSAFSQR